MLLQWVSTLSAKRGDENMSLKAQCACKSVSIELANDPVRCFVCHCDYCQRLTGSFGSAVAIFREEDVVKISGEAVEFDPKMENWPGLKKYVCPDCYSNVHWTNPKAFPGMRLVSLGGLENPSSFKIDRTVQNQYRPTWCPKLHASEAHDAYPE